MPTTAPKPTETPVTTAAAYSNRELIVRFGGFYRGHGWQLLSVLLCAGVLAVLELCFPMVTRHILQTILYQANLDLVQKWSWILLAVVSLIGVTQYLQTYYGHALGVKLETRIRERLFRHLETLSFGYYDRNRTGELMSRCLNDLFEITELANHGPSDLSLSVLMFAGAFVILFPISPLLTTLLFLWLPVLAVYAVWARRPMFRSFMALRKHTARFNVFFENSISGIRVIKGFGNEADAFERFQKHNRHYGSAKQATFKRIAVFVSGIGFLTHLTHLSVMMIGCILICKNQLKVEDLVAFLLYVHLVLQPIQRLSHFVDQFEQAMSGFRRFLEIVDTPSGEADSPQAVELAHPEGYIEFKDVVFGYSPEEPVLNGISFAMKPGETLALVGPSGGGKTTICSLIPHFYEWQKGEIRIDGVDARQYTRRSLRRQIGIVQQEVFLFAGSFKDNIRIGKPEATDEEVVAAAKHAAIHDFIISCPGGYDAEVGDHGVLLSGGQRQRIAIARVFLKNPPVLLLDEATSALDNNSEKQVQQSLNSLAAGRTTIVVAHRLSTIRNASQILYIDHGRVLESGTHDELMRLSGGYYRRLHGV